MNSLVSQQKPQFFSAVQDIYFTVGYLFGFWADHNFALDWKNWMMACRQSSEVHLSTRTSTSARLASWRAAWGLFLNISFLHAKMDWKDFREKKETCWKEKAVLANTMLKLKWSGTRLDFLIYFWKKLPDSILCWIYFCDIRKSL